jgi:DNA-binding transcriptional LysR family regulator
MDRLASLNAFVRVAEDGGFSAAARRLNVSKATLSDQVQALENVLGVRLLARTTRQVTLTEIGREYYERCSQILQDLDDADQAVSTLQAAPHGRLRIFCHQGGIGRFIAPAVLEYSKRYSEVWVDMRVGDALVDLAQQGFDLAISPMPPANSNLIKRRLATWRVMVYCSPRYLETHERPMVPADLTSHNCIRNPYTATPDDWHFVDQAGQPVVVRVSGNLVTTSIDAMRATALAGAGLMMAPPFIVSDLLASGELVPILTDYRTPENELVVLYPDRRHLTAKARAFVELLVECFESEQSWLVPV